jgi:hypothetical protein
MHKKSLFDFILFLFQFKFGLKMFKLFDLNSKNP